MGYTIENENKRIWVKENVDKVFNVHVYLHNGSIGHKGLVINYGVVGGGGWAIKREGGASEVLPLRRGGGGGQSFRHAEGGGTQQVLG